MAHVSYWTLNPEILTRLESVARTTERLNVPVRVRPAEGERLHVVHVDSRRENVPQTPSTASPTRLTDHPPEPASRIVAAREEW